MTASTGTAAASVAVQKPWRAQLELNFERAGDRTVVHRSHSGPLLIQRPFYAIDGSCQVVLLHPPAGIVGGDRLLIDVHASHHSKALLTTPGATRFYGSDGRSASQLQRIRIIDSAFEWLPHETIYFNACVAQQTLQLDMNRHSSFIGWDISCMGRPAGDFPFEYGQVDVALDISVDAIPVLRERLSIIDQASIRAASGLRGHCVYGTLLAVSPSQDAALWLSSVRDNLPELQFAATVIDNLLVVRYLGDSTEHCKKVFTLLWQRLRYMMSQCQPATPRIWAT